MFTLLSRRSLTLVLLALLLSGCRSDADTGPSPVAVSPLAPATSTDSPTVPLPDTATAPASPSAAPTATRTQAPMVMATPTVAPADTATPDLITDLALAADGIFLYPVPELFEGDVVTFQIIADVPALINPNDVGVHIYVDETRVVDDTLRFRNLAGQTIGLYEWIWDSAGQAGEHRLEVRIDPADRIQEGDADPDNNDVVLPLVVNPAATRPLAERDAVWSTTAGAHADIHVVTNTAAHRDLPFLTATTDAAIQQAMSRLDETPLERLQVYFIERVIGQGGYAGGVMVVTYSDRDYAGDGLYEVLVHEAVHLLDRQIAPNRIPFLTEGVAVWATGGHYKQEDLLTRSAALLASDLYVPLPQLIDDFYPVQHEIGYLEAGGLVHYLVEQYGYPRFKQFYADYDALPGEAQSEAVSRLLLRHYGLSLAEIETAWHAALRQATTTERDVVDLLTTVRYYNVMRDYQQAYDPTAYFLQAWLPFPVAAQERGLVADFLRRPDDVESIALETMLLAADGALRLGAYDECALLLDSVDRVLETGRFADPLAQAYRQLVDAGARLGYDVQRIDLRSREAQLVVRPLGSNELLQLTFVRSGARWVPSI